MKPANKILISLLITGTSVMAQDGPGMLSGSLYSVSHIYYNDNATLLLPPPDRVGSNNFLLVRYSNGPLSAGLQYEAYMPPIVGTPYSYEGNYIPFRFIRYNHRLIDITAGTFYDQFGSGLSFRAFEDRALGLNTSLDGVRLIVRPSRGVTVKSFAGKQRRFDDYTDARLRGADAEINIGQLLKKNIPVNLGGGVVSRYNEYTGSIPGTSPYRNAVSARAGFNSKNLSFDYEYVSIAAGKPGAGFFKSQPGKAFLLNSSYNRKGLGIFFSGRILDAMAFPSESEIRDGFSNINYLPSNTRQSAYMLPNLYPWATRQDGELSYQADVTWKPRWAGGGNPLRQLSVRINYSDTRSLEYSDPEVSPILLFATKRYYRDFSLETEKRWGPTLKTKLVYQSIFLNRGELEGAGDELIDTDIVVADVSWRPGRRLSVRTELQHLWTGDDLGNWYAILSEISLAPSYSVYFSNMTDYQSADNINYYSAGVSWRTGYATISAGYGRYREGYVCSGGVCRKIPGYKGINITVTSSF